MTARSEKYLSVRTFWVYPDFLSNFVYISSNRQFLRSIDAAMSFKKFGNSSQKYCHLVVVKSENLVGKQISLFFVTSKRWKPVQVNQLGWQLIQFLLLKPILLYDSLQIMLPSLDILSKMIIFVCLCHPYKDHSTILLWWTICIQQKYAKLK